MLKRILPLFLLFSLFSSKSFSQDFLGLSTGNYSGISGVSTQPASIVDSRYKFDINLFSTGINYSNNYFLLDRDVLLKFNKNKFDDYASFKERYLSEATLESGEKAFFNINNRTQLPLSFMATTGEKSAIALNMQFRTMMQGRGISRDVASLAYNDFYHSPLNNRSMDASGINLNSLSWAEVGLTYGRVLFSSDKHFLKGAITGKYLAGLSSMSLSSDDLQMRVNSDSTFNFNTSNVSYSHNKNADFNKLFDKNFSPNANAFGLDAGLVYEYRGNIDKFKYLKADDEKSYDALRRDVNKYIFKLGVSLLDMGMFNFDKPANVNSFSANINNWDIRNAQYNSIKNFDTALANRVIANPNDPNNYNVYLPTALSAQFDVKFVKGLFLNVRSYWPVSLGDEAGKRFDKYGYYTITPRFETRHFGIYIPYTVGQRNDLTDYKQHMLGATVRLGPLFVGSSNLGSMLFNSKLKSADVHVGLKVGFTYGKPNKSNLILSSVINEKQTRDTSVSREIEKDIIVLQKTDKNRQENNVIIDYKSGKVYDNPGVKQNITIINNYYYGTNPAERMADTISMLRNYPMYQADSMQAKRLKMAAQKNQVLADSISKITTDSLKLKKQQLDSLINSMQQLQKDMDSTMKSETNKETDSSVSIMLKMNSFQGDFDSLNFKLDSLKAVRGEALMALSPVTYRQDSARVALSGQLEQEAVKKKEQSEPKSGLIRSKSESSLPVSQNLNADSLQRQNELNDNFTKRLQQMQDSLDRMAERNSIMTDSLTKARSLVKEGADTTVVRSQQKSAVPPARMQDRNVTDSKDFARLQQQQNELLRQYARQADMLSKDIDRLNSRIREDRRNYRNNTNFIPVPVPVSSGNTQQAPRAVASVPQITDTVYIRDSVVLRDSIRIIDTVNTFSPETFVFRPVKEVAKTDTVFREIVKSPEFDFASLPEENILFALGQKSLQPIYEGRLDFIASILKDNADLKVRITGHTDSSGSRAINEILSLQRAEAVAGYLVNKGVAERQIKLISQSFENPAVSGNSAAARSQNRRVALKFEKLDK